MFRVPGLWAAPEGPRERLLQQVLKALQQACGAGGAGAQSHVDARPETTSSATKVISLSSQIICRHPHHCAYAAEGGIRSCGEEFEP